MNRQLVGEPGVSVFLQSVLRYMADIRRMERTYTAYLYYDPNPHLEKLKSKLVSLQDVLLDGEARRLDEASVDEWMDDLKDLLYDLEDILDDIKETLIVQSDGANQVNFNHTHFYGISNAIKDRMGKILGWTDELVDRSKDLGLRRGVGYVTWGKSHATPRTVETSPEVEMSEIHGRVEDKNVIVERLLAANDKAKKNYDVLCIVGMGGLGKTTLAQLVFNDSEVVKHFDVKSWVCISNVFDIARATKELIEYSGGGGSLGGQQSLAGLQRRLKEMVLKKRFLFVMDDVWSSTEWETMKAPLSSCATGSKILVTTRNINIAYALGNKEPYPLQGLDHKQCMAIFKDKAFAVDDEEEHEKMMLGEKIVRACGGVPLAVKVIGSMLQDAEEEKWRVVSKSTDLWNIEYIKDGIHPAIRLSYHYLPGFLKRCFEYLAIFPPNVILDEDDVVRLWIADGLVQEVDGRMAEDIGNEYYNELKARSLIQENNMMHDIVQNLATLVSRKFCYKENSNEPPTGMRHAFVANLNPMVYEFLAQAPSLRTLIVREIEDENVLRKTLCSCKMLRTLKVGSKISYWMTWSGTLSLGESSIGKLAHLRYLNIQGWYVKNLPDWLIMLNNLQFLDLGWNLDVENLPRERNHLPNLRRLILSYSFISSLPESVCTLGQLQVLNLDNCKSLKFLPENIGNLSSLRTLDLRRTSISSLPESICALSQLKFLSLRDCKSLKQLPKDIGHLRSLRTLDLRTTSILSVPESILNVTGLEHLFVDEHRQLPLHIGRLARLEELPAYHVGREEGLRLGELNLMNKLGGQLKIVCMENIGNVEEAFKADMKSKKNITELKFRWSQPGNDQETEVKIMEALKPHHAL